MRAAPHACLSITTRLDEGEFVQVGIADTGLALLKRWQQSCFSLL